METSDRRYQELLALMGVRGGGNRRAQSPASAFVEGRAEVEAIEPGASAGRRTRVQVRLIASQVAARQLQHHHSDLAPRPTIVAREAKEILLVDPDPEGLRAVQAALRLVADVEVCSDFREARARLLDQPPDLLITNLRLRAYNGLHLVHLAAGTQTRCIVYSTYDDLVLGARGAGGGSVFRTPVSSAHGAPIVRERHASPTGSTESHGTRSANGFSWWPALQRCVVKQRPEILG